MLIYWFLPIIIFLGVITSYEDIKFGKIRNKWIVLGVVYAAVIHFFLYFLNAPYNLGLTTLKHLLISGFFALVAGFLIWFLGLWTAGDAKLLFAYTLLIPNTNSLSFADVLINSFIPVGIFLFFASLMRIGNLKKMPVTSIFKAGNIYKTALAVFAAMWLGSILHKITGMDAMLLAFALVIGILMIDKFFPRDIFLVMLTAIALLRILADKSIHSFGAWLNFLLVLATILIIRFLLVMPSQSFVKDVAFDRLKPGDQPAEIIIKSGNAYKRRKAGILSLYKKQDGSLFHPKPEGLSEDDIRKISASAKHFTFKELKIRETISFAPFLFTGALLQMILNDNLISYLINALF